MRAGVIAAGDGSRLASTGLIKPMVPVNGRPLCHWVAGSLKAAGLTDVTILFNSRGGPARDSLRINFPSMTWTFLEKDTPSSWESFKLVAKTLAARGEPFLITTTDTILPPEQLRSFIDKCAGAKAALALTSFIDDEKPLLATLEGDRITQLGQGALATAGVYYLSPEVIVEGQHGALRQFLTALVSKIPVRGIVIPKTLDVDRPEDIQQAEKFITWSTA
jgi:NDP-sugar pyrophosphorylase family protein